MAALKIVPFSLELAKIYNLIHSKFWFMKHAVLCKGLHRLETYLHLEGFLEKSLKIKYAWKSTGKSLKCLEKPLNSSIFCRT